jgi:hypothetical protein
VLPVGSDGPRGPRQVAIDALSGQAHAAAEPESGGECCLMHGQGLEVSNTYADVLVEEGDCELPGAHACDSVAVIGDG